MNEEFIDLLLQRCDIETVVSKYMTLKRSGSSLVGLCPFHGEKTPSFHVTKEKGLYYCFGCHEGGNAITFVSKIENVDKIDAIEMLATSVGMEMPHDNKTDNRQSELRKTIYQINKEAASFFHNTLLSESGKKARAYLTGRQLTKNTVTKFGLGYSPDSWDALLNHLIKKGYKTDDIVVAGLATVNAKGRIFDRFRNRVMFPIIDHKGNVIAFGGRTMGDDPAKYLNTSDTIAFSKGNNLYALNFAKSNAQNGLILCEGYMDVISLHQAGIGSAVASLGTALTQNQAKLIKRFTSTVYLCYDNDKAGNNATKKNLEVLSAENIRVKVIKIPNGKDPDEFLKNNSAAEFRKLLEDGVSKIDYKINELKGMYNIEFPEQKIGFLNSIIPVLAGISNSMEAEIYIKKISEETDISTASISSEILKYRKKQAKHQSESVKRKTYDEAIHPDIKSPHKNSEDTSNYFTEDSIIKIMLNFPEFIGTAKEIISPDDFPSDFGKQIFKVLSDNYPFDSQEPINVLLSETDTDYASKIVPMVMNSDGLLTDKNIFVGLCKKLKNRDLHKSESKLKDLSDEELENKLKSIQNKHKNGE